MNRKICKLLTIVLTISLLYVPGCGFGSQPEILHVAIPYSDNIPDIDTNYYINYLEEKTGIDIVVSFVKIESCDEYLKMLFDSGAEIDIVLFGGSFVPGDGVLEEYASRGDIYLPDGEYKYVSEGWDTPAGAGTVLWINKEWLVNLGMPIPKTSDELEDVLEAFKTGDPNGNGIHDEIPLAGSAGEYDLNPVEFLMGSFAINDPYHSRMTADGKRIWADPAYRDGLEYCRGLYEKGLMDKGVFDCSYGQLCEMVNSPVPIVGAFTSSSIGDVIYRGNPEVMARYVHVPPLTGPAGEAYAMIPENKTRIGAIILSRSEKKEEAQLLLDTMMSEEASLIARFGEPGVDWDYSDGKDISIYMTPSTIITKNYIRDVVQNKNLNGVGPMAVPEKYIYGVTWNGLNSDAEYVDARAQMAYMDFFVDPGGELPVGNAELSEYLDRHMIAFVTGEEDVRSDSIWREYVSGAEEILH
ncbi:MAG: extracellular solute-binding protein [Lachnospiraceae bacterium]|nr:extracellular solute-binding protein [Lachnospiraceae bacterium]